MSVRALVRLAGLGAASLAVTVAFAAMSPPSAAQGSAAPAPAAAAKLAKGKELFGNFGCGGCHTLADAGATGRIGPAFDGDPNLTEAFVTDRVTNGQGSMPAFGGQISDADIAALAAYVTHAAAK